MPGFWRREGYKGWFCLSSQPSLTSHRGCWNVWQRLTRGGISLISGKWLFWKEFYLCLCGVKRGVGRARGQVAGKGASLHGPHEVHPRWSPVGGVPAWWGDSWPRLFWWHRPPPLCPTLRIFKTGNRHEAKHNGGAESRIFSWEGSAPARQLPRPGTTKYAPKENSKIPAILINPKMFCVKTVKFYLYPQEYTQLSKTSIFYALIFKLLFFSFSFLLRRYLNIKADNVSLKQRYKPLISFQNIYNVIFCLLEDFYLQICFPIWVWMN